MADAQKEADIKYYAALEAQMIRDKDRQFLKEEAGRISDRITEMDAEDDVLAREKARRALVGTCWKRETVNQITGMGMEYYLVTGINHDTGHKSGIWVYIYLFRVDDNGAVEFDAPGRITKHGGDSEPLTPNEFEHALTDCLTEMRLRQERAKAEAPPRAFVPLNTLGGN